MLCMSDSYYMFGIWTKHQLVHKGIAGVCKVLQ